MICTQKTLEGVNFPFLLSFISPPPVFSARCVPLQIVALLTWCSSICPSVSLSVRPTVRDGRALWTNSGLSARASECQKLKMVGYTSMALEPSNSSNLEQLALKGLTPLDPSLDMQVFDVRSKIDSLVYRKKASTTAWCWQGKQTGNSFPVNSPYRSLINRIWGWWATWRWNHVHHCSVGRSSEKRA